MTSRAHAGDVPPGAREAVDACADGELPAEVALMKLAMSCSSAAEVDAVVSGALAAASQRAPSARVTRLIRLYELSQSHPDAFETVTKMLDVVRHDEPPRSETEPHEPVSRVARAFDRAARLCPEASVALYSLGDPLRLAAATRELVEQMRAWQLLGRERTFLDIGCGIGRLEEALSPEVAFITGIDVSPVMLELARQRCDVLPNVSFELSSGHDLAAFEGASFDGVLAVDCFPYLFQCGIAVVERNVLEAARVLKPGGHLLIFNFSYRADLAADRADMLRLSEAAGFTVLRNGVHVLETWDGAAFHLVKSA
jgi:ubiquinone/menaquinone biosynthesis C-methylase UbiE